MAAQLPPERPGRPAPPDLLARRQGLAAAMASGMWRVDPPPAEIRLGGVRCLRFDPPAASRGTILHLHGGAFRIGAPEQLAPFAAALAASCTATVICPAYRLAPEYPFPAGLADAQDVLRDIGTQHRGPLLLSGDSAGGGLAASLTALAIDDGIAIAGLVLLSAWLDLTLSSASYARNAAADPVFSHAAASEAAALYLQGAPATAPLASPLLGSLACFPPSFVSAGAGEVLADDATQFCAGLRQAGVAATLSLIPDMEHTAVARGMALTGATETFTAVVGFVTAILAGRR